MNNIQVSIPNYLFLQVGEMAEGYLTFTDSTTDNALKIASYVLSLGVFPAVALLTVIKYQKVQSESIYALQTKASESLAGALWVSKHIKLFRLHHDYQKYNILENATKSIGNNYRAFRQQLGQESSAQWFKNFEMEDSYYAERTLNELIERIENVLPMTELSSSFNIIGDYELTSDARLDLFRGLCWKGILPQPNLLTPDERYQVALTAARARGMYFGTNLLMKCLNAYQLTREQNFEVFKVTCKEDTAMFQFIPQFNFTYTERIEFGEMAKACFVAKREKYLKENPSNVYRNEKDSYCVISYLKDYLGELNHLNLTFVSLIRLTDFPVDFYQTGIAYELASYLKNKLISEGLAILNDANLAQADKKSLLESKIKIFYDKASGFNSNQSEEVGKDRLKRWLDFTSSQLTEQQQIMFKEAVKKVLPAVGLLERILNKK